MGNIGKVGAPLATVFTKDRMGFDLETIKRTSRHENHSDAVIYRSRARDARMRGEFSGETAKAARNSVSLPHVKWMDGDEG